MGAKALQDILGRKILTASYQKVKSGVPKPLPAAFYAARRGVMGNIVNYVEDIGSRQVSQTTRYGAKANRIVHTGRGEKPLSMIHSFESWDLNPQQLMYLMSDQGVEEELGESEVMRLLQEDKVRSDNLRATATHMALLLGELHFDTRELLPNDTGAVVSIEFGVNATTNKGACQEIDGATAIFGSWATSTTDIQGQLETVKRTAIQRTGYALRYAFYGKNVKGYLNKNDTLGNLMNGNSVDAATALRGRLPEIEDLLWVDVSGVFYDKLNADGSVTTNELVPEDTVVFTPDPANVGWWDFVEGTTIVPGQTGLISDVNAVIGTMEHARGQFAYGQGKMNPVTAEIFHGDTFLPMLLSADAIFIATVQA